MNEGGSSARLGSVRNLVRETERERYEERF